MNHQQHLWQADEGCPLDEWSEDEDIAWTTLLGRPALSSDEDEDEVGREEVPVRREDLVKDQNVVHVNKEELEDDGAGGFVVTEYSVSGQTIVIKQQPLLGIAHQVWHASLVLTDYFNCTNAFPPSADGENWWKGKRVVELGAGTGIPGIYLASKGARVVLTDLPDVVSLMEWNIKANNSILPASDCCEAAPLAWGTQDKHIRRPIDVVVASDVVYWEHLFEPLAHTLNSICSEETVVFLSWQKRRKNDRMFFKRIAKNFTSEELKISPSQAVTMNPKHLKKTHLFKLHKRPVRGTSRHCKQASDRLL